MIDKMQAVVYTAPQEMTFINDYHSNQVDRDDDVLLRIQAVGICGSDMHAYHGKDPRRNPGLHRPGVHQADNPTRFFSKSGDPDRRRRT